MNLPIAAVALVLHVLFLHVGCGDDREASVAARLRRIDYVGNGLPLVSVTAVLVALAYGGTRYPWSSWRILVPLLLGGAVLGLFMWYETSPRWCAEPVTPPHPFRNRTSAAAFFLTFTHSLYSFLLDPLLPLGVLSSRAPRDPPATGSPAPPDHRLPGAGRHSQRSDLDQDGALPAAAPGGLRAHDARGGALHPARQEREPRRLRDRPDRGGARVRARADDAAAAGTAAAGRIEDATARTMVAYGQAYAHASSELRLALPSRAREQVIGVFTDSLRLVWIVAAVIAGFSFFVVFVEKEIKLRDDLEAEFGLKGGEVDGGREEEGGKGSEKGIVG